MTTDKKEKIDSDWQRLETYGVVLYGSSWQTPLSISLRLMNPSHVRGWKRRGVPDYVWDKVKKIAQNKIIEINEVIL